MAEPKQPDAPGAEPVRQAGGDWTEEEKARGAAQPGRDAGAAGDASAKGRPTDDRARTEGAAGSLAGGRKGGDGEAGAPPDRPAPPADTPVVGGRGHRSMGGTATEPEAEPDAPRNPL